MKGQLWRKLLIILLVGLFSIITTDGILASTTGNATHVTEKNKLTAAIKNKLTGNDKIKKCFFKDFDNDGNYEAFFLTGQPVDDSNEDTGNTLWFGCIGKGKANVAILKKDVLSSSHVLNLKSEKLFCVGYYAGNSFPEELYRVKGHVVSSIFSGNAIQKVKGDSFSTVSSVYDAAYENGEYCGHTCYFYYKQGRINEYKAVSISEKELIQKYKNAKLLLSKYKKQNGNFLSAYVRKNGKVHINFSQKDGLCTNFSNITFDIKKNKLCNPIEDGGTYHASYYDE